MPSPSDTLLPPGQFAEAAMFRFGVPAFAPRLPQPPLHDQIAILGPRRSSIGFNQLSSLTRAEIIADFHCVTTWSVRALHWSGYRLSDVLALATDGLPVSTTAYPFLRFHCADGAKICVERRDLDLPDVILADRLNGQPLSLTFGAPMRLVAPHLYGYKNPKHIQAIEFSATYVRGTAERQTIAHPRGRVAHEERGRFLPGWAYSYVYRALIGPTRRRYERASIDAAKA